jgi:hypothetical protein
MLVDKIQNKCTTVNDGFVFMYMLNPVIGSTEQKRDLCYTMYGPHLGWVGCCPVSIAGRVRLVTLFSVRER